MLRHCATVAFLFASVGVSLTLSSCAGARTSLPPEARLPGSLSSGPLVPAIVPSLIYVTDESTNAVTIYPIAANGNVAPSKRISGTNTRLNNPGSEAFDSTGRLHVKNSAGPAANCITGYAAGTFGNISPISDLCGPHTGLTGPNGMAFGPLGRLYVTNYSGATNTSSILVFAANATGDTSPLFRITGSSTRLNVPGGLAFDSSFRLYVANTDSSTITVYPPGKFGNVAPIAIIHGSNTHLVNPEDVKIGPSSKIYVGNVGRLITVYPAGANGNVASLQAIRLPGSPGGIAVDPTGNIFVTILSFPNQLEVFAPGANGTASPIRVIKGSNTGLSFPIDVTLH